MRRLHQTLQGHVGRGGLTGLVAAVGHGGLTHVEVLGHLDAGGTRPMQRDSIFRISSMTKPIVAVATMALVEAGDLQLDAPVDDVLPELADRRVLRTPDAATDDAVPAERPITVRDLLTSRMGIGHVLAPPGTYPIQAVIAEQGFAPGPPIPQSPPEPDEWMRRLGALPLMHQPGQVWQYHLSVQVLGVLIARTAGQPLGPFLQERIFEPLGMVDTSFSVPPGQLDRLVTSYCTDQDSGATVVYDPPDGQWSRPPAFPDGGAGLVSTVEDYLAFGQMLLAGGRAGDERILSPATVDAMTTNQLSPHQQAAAAPILAGKGWGLGLAVVTEPDKPLSAPGRFGWDGGLGTSWASDPATGLVGVLLTQRLWDAPTPPAVLADFWDCAGEVVDS